MVDHESYRLGRRLVPAAGASDNPIFARSLDLSGSDGRSRATLTCDDLHFQAEQDDFADALHKGIEILGLSVAAVESGNRGNVVAILVLFYQDHKFSFLLQASPLFAKVYHEEGKRSNTGRECSTT